MRRAVLVLFVGVLVLPAVALADPFSPFNVRPVALNPPPGGEASVQTILNAMFGPGAPNAATDQSAAGMWTAPAGHSFSRLLAEFAGNAAVNQFGIWFGNDSSSLYAVDILLGQASSGTTAELSFAGNTLTIQPSYVGTCGISVNCGSFTDPRVTAGGFGFFIDVGGGLRYYTVDQLNPGGQAHGLAYQGTTVANQWVMAFEDGRDFDYNDMAVKVTAISAVPEPASLGLFGSGLIGLATILRRKLLS